MSDAFSRAGDAALMFEAALDAGTNTADAVMVVLGDRLTVVPAGKAFGCSSLGEVVDDFSKAAGSVIGDLLVFAVALLRLRENEIGATPADTVRLLNEGETE